MLALVLVLSVLTLKTNAQQLEQFSQFDQQMYILNPAVAGSTDYFEAKAVNRSQWTGVTDAPRTFAMSLQAPLKNPHVGLGGFLMTDNVGPTRRTSLQFSYTYQLFLNNDLKLGLGISAGLLQFTIDGTKIKLAEEGDPALFSEMNSQTVFDAKFAAYLHKENWYAGFSLPQLLQNQVQLFESTSGDLSKLEDHYLIMGGYTYELNNDFKIQANALAKFVAPVNPALDANIKAYYQNKVNVGVGYRHKDALIFMAGYEYREAVSIGFSYDMTTSALKNYSNGTYEVMVGFRFNQ
ncbi:MAG: PorP/SprF family type IX secretion system membrane protein [Flavobacteriales bacterium]